MYCTLNNPTTFLEQLNRMRENLAGASVPSTNRKYLRHADSNVDSGRMTAGSKQKKREGMSCDHKFNQSGC